MIARRPSWRSPPLLRHPASRQKTPFTPSFLADKKSIAVAIVGGIREVEGIANSAKIEQLARFAVDEPNKKETALLEFLVRVVKAKERVVARGPAPVDRRGRRCREEEGRRGQGVGQAMAQLQGAAGVQARCGLGLRIMVVGKEIIFVEGRRRRHSCQQEEGITRALVV
ncbi:unnamed protein product [Musa acuminata subsp. burmannicoides]